MNLKPSICAILDSYALNKDSLSLDEKIVLKTILLFQAIDQESHGQIDIFRPIEKNLELAFTGVDDMENGRAVTIANNLVRKDILFKKPGKVETFAEMERLKKSVADNVRTAELVEVGKLLEAINLTPAQKVRYILFPVTADNFKLTINRITNEAENYRVKAVVCFARNEDEQDKIYNLIDDAIHEARYHRLVFINAASNLISRDVFMRWVDNSANERYWRGKDNAQANQSAKVILSDLWQMSANYWEVYPDLNISRLKIELDARIFAELEKNVRIAFGDIFELLTERGFMPLNIYAFLTGFLLKEYAGDPYHPRRKTPPFSYGDIRRRLTYWKF